MLCNICSVLNDKIKCICRFGQQLWYWRVWVSTYDIVFNKCRKLQTIYNFLCLIEALLLITRNRTEITSCLSDRRLSKHKSDLIFLYPSVFRNMCTFIADFILPFIWSTWNSRNRSYKHLLTKGIYVLIFWRRIPIFCDISIIFCQYLRCI